MKTTKVCKLLVKKYMQNKNAEVKIKYTVQDAAYDANSERWSAASENSPPVTRSIIGRQDDLTSLRQPKRTK